MKKLKALIFSLVLAQALSAQQAGIIKMDVQGADAQKAVRLSELHVEAQIVGTLAVTTLDMLFVNDTNRVLEGEFEFPLGAGETVTGYALDINGKLRQGVSVEKDKGRQVFEAVVRQGIDPGLIEMTAGNNFRTRVYPLPAKGSRRVQVSYESELPADRTYTYSALPDGELDAFSFRINVLSSAEKKAPATSKRRISFDDMNSGKTASMEYKHYRLEAPITFVVPQESLPAEGSVFIQDAGKDTYFYFTQHGEAEARAKKAPGTLAIFYDVSASMKHRNRDDELALLAAYFASCNPKVTVTTFSNRIHETKTFSAPAGTELAAQIAAFLRAQDYDGASCLELGFGSVQADEILLFTDGISTWQGGSTGSGAAQPPVTVINSSARADHDSLAQYAAQHGGAYVNLCTLGTEQALPLLTQEQLRIISADYDSAAITDVYPLPGSTVTGNLSVSGILKRKKADVTVKLGYGSTVTRSVTFTVDAAANTQSERVIRLWAAKKIAALSADYEANKAEITELAKKHTIVTRGMSLIVLDNVQDYVRYGIEPPNELREEYNRIVSRQGTGKSQGAGNTIPQEVYRCFKQFREWWNTSPEEFKKKKSPPKKGGPIRPLNGRVYRDSDAAGMVVESVESAPMEDAMAEAAPAPAGSAMQRVQRNRMMSAAPAAPALAEAKEAAGTSSAGGGQTIQLQAWNPGSDYLVTLKRTPKEGMYAAYLKLRGQYESSPAFYMEVSDYFAEEGLMEESLRILSNLAELNLENSDILRALGNKLVEREQYALAVPVFEKLVRMRSEIPQFQRDLAMAYYHAGQPQKAVDTLYALATKAWDSRFAEIQQIALNDMNAIIAASGKGEVSTKNMDKELLQNFDMDVRIVLTWNMDDCDVDLWVTDGDGEKCYYGNKLTANGGRISRDFTMGYGPEEFCLKQAPAGALKIEANYFASHQQKLLQPVTVQAEVYTDFGRPTQKRQVLTLQLDSVKQTFFIGTVQSGK